MVRVDVAFTPSEAVSAPVGIVVDVLRASSTIAQALASGWPRVLCAPGIDEAKAVREQLGEGLLGGERMGVRIDGFDVGASPREFLDGGDVPLIFTTTNGTRAVPDGRVQLRAGLPRQPAESRRGRRCGTRHRAGRRDRLRGLQRRVRARRRLLRRAHPAAARRRPQRCGEGGGAGRSLVHGPARRPDRADLRAARPRRGHPLLRPRERARRRAALYADARPRGGDHALDRLEFGPAG